LRAAPWHLRGSVEESGRDDQDDTWQTVLPHYRALKGIYGPLWREQRVSHDQPALQWKRGWDQMFPDLHPDDRVPFMPLNTSAWIAALNRPD
jgi:hypothetical protein